MTKKRLEFCKFQALCGFASEHSLNKPGISAAGHSADEGPTLRRSHLQHGWRWCRWQCYASIRRLWCQQAGTHAVRQESTGSSARNLQPL